LHCAARTQIVDASLAARAKDKSNEKTRERTWRLQTI